MVFFKKKLISLIVRGRTKRGSTVIGKLYSQMQAKIIIQRQKFSSKTNALVLRHTCVQSPINCFAKGIHFQGIFLLDIQLTIHHRISLRTVIES